MALSALLMSQQATLRVSVQQRYVPGVSSARCFTLIRSPPALRLVWPSGNNEGASRRSLVREVVFQEPLEPVPSAIPQHCQHECWHPQQLAAGEFPVLKLREEIKSLRLTGDCFGDEPAGDAGECDAVPRESL